MKIRLIDFGVAKEHCPFRPHENDAGADVYIFPRSSMAIKGLICELPPIDSGYRGEIHAIISNVSNQEHILKKNTRIGQLVITPVIIADFVFEHGKQRGKNSFGSTGI